MQMGHMAVDHGKRVRRCRKCDGPKPEVSEGRMCEVNSTDGSERTIAACVNAAC